MHLDASCNGVTRLDEARLRQRCTGLPAHSITGVMFYDRTRILLAAAALSSASLAACDRTVAAADGDPTPATGSDETAEATMADEAAPPRLVAVGDVHGDLASAREALQLAGAVDADGNWIGGRMTLVQVGDQTDRGDDELEILEWFAQLDSQAANAGGAFHALVGNHEIMNIQLDLRYVTEGGFEDFADTPFDPDDPAFADVPDEYRGRVAAFRPGGPWAIRLAEFPVAIVLDGTLFVHGALEPQHAALGIETLNLETARWMRGEAAEPEFIRGPDSPVWSRDYSTEPDAAACAELAESLRLVGAERMVVGHTVQREGITSACDERVWRIDVGLADYYGGATEVLEIVGDEVRVLR